MHLYVSASCDPVNNLQPRISQILQTAKSAQTRKSAVDTHVFQAFEKMLMFQKSQLKIQLFGYSTRFSNGAAPMFLRKCLHYNGLELCRCRYCFGIKHA